jgi:cytochrome c oxidase subunit II
LSESSPPTPIAQPGNPAPAYALDRVQRVAVISIGVAAVALGILAGLRNPFLIRAASREGGEIDALFSLLLGIAVAIFVLVQGTLLFIVLRFGRSASDESDGPSIRGYLPAEILWTAIPAIIVTGLSIYSYQVLTSIDSPRANALVVEVRAQQFSWEFGYPGRGVTSDVLHIPLGRQVLFRMHSDDVIHSFWVPDFRLKKDIMPDRVTEQRFTGTRLGTYPIVCSRLCGVGHAFMRSSVIVESPTDFEAWLVAQAKAEDDTADPLVYGRKLFHEYGCNGCHTLSDAQATGDVGPNLDGIGVRAGRRVPGQDAQDYLREAIVRPDAYIVPGYQVGIMPKDLQQRMSARELQALVQYLLMQRQP